MPRSIGRRAAPVHGTFRAPASKPETQRAMLMGALGRGRTVVRRPLVARETLVMMAACRALGAEVELRDDRLEVEGIGDRLETPRGTRYVWASGSALVARTFAAIGSALPDPVVIDGNCVLRGRPFEPLFAALRPKGVAFEFLDAPNRLPCVARSTALPGGRFRLATSTSSQFATALLVPAPLALAPTSIELTGPTYSISYIRQTLEMMRRFGVDARLAEGGRSIAVPAGQGYRARDVEVTGDWTSASYLLGAAYVTRGRVALAGLDPGNAQGERAILGILEGLGARVRWLGADTVEVDATALPDEVDAAFDLRDGPNILPTVAAVAATAPGRVRITGARLTQHHKSRRVDAMAQELAKAGIAAAVLHDGDGMVDGLEVRGRASHAGGVAFSSHGDHRIFMSLAILALAGERPSLFSDAADDTADSFPGFAEVLGLTKLPTTTTQQETFCDAGARRELV